MLHILHELPPGLLTADVRMLRNHLSGPTLIHLPGRQPQPLFVSVLLHGDETTGLQAIQALLRSYQTRQLPRALSLFVGNVDAACVGMRRLDGQPDYNRIWPGGAVAACPETQLAGQVWEAMRRREVFASVDIHNNTGINPHYGCINRLDQSFLHLASWFSRTVVYFTYPPGTQTSAFARLCPAVTLECGKPGTEYGAEHACRYVDACLHLSHFPDSDVAHEDVDLYHTVAVVKVPDNVSFTFAPEPADICFDPRLDHLNFRELCAETSLAGLAQGQDVPLQVLNIDGRDVVDDYFVNRDGQLCLRVPCMPAMLTVQARAIRQDCLCYLMQRLPLPHAHKA